MTIKRRIMGRLRSTCFYIGPLCTSIGSLYINIVTLYRYLALSIHTYWANVYEVHLDDDLGVTLTYFMAMVTTVSGVFCY